MSVAAPLTTEAAPLVATARYCRRLRAGVTLVTVSVGDVVPP